MPRILPYEQRTSAAAPLGPRPVPQPFGQSNVTGGIASALGSLSEDQATLRAFEKQKAEERAAVMAHEEVTSSRSRWIEELQTRQQEAPEAGAGFAVATLKDFDNEGAERVKRMPTQASRDWLKQRLANVRLGLQSDALAFEAQRGAEYKVNGLSRAIDQARIAAEFRPEEFPTLAAEQRAAIQASGLNPQAQAKLAQEAVSVLADASVRGMVRSDPVVALKELNSEGTRNLAVRALSFDQREQLRTAAEAEMRRREMEVRAFQAEARQALGERVRDASAAYRLGLEFDGSPSRAEFIMALGTDDGNKAFEAFRKEQQLGPAIRTLATASDAEQNALLAKFAPTGTAGTADAAERYRVLAGQADHLRRQREADPAAYAVRYSPRVQEAFAAAQESPQAARAYATATIAEQLRLGVARPQILPEAVADSIAQSFYTQQGEQVAALIQTEQQKWGSHWPQVFGELAAKKIPPAALAIGRGMQPGAAIRLAGTSATPMEELKEGVDAPAAEVRDAIDSSMTDFLFSLDGVVGGENTFSGMRDAVQRLTYSYLRQGKSIGDATGQAYGEVVGDHYSFRDINGRTLRVPIAEDSDDVEVGARMALERMPLAEINLPVPTSTGSDQTAANDLARAIRKRGYWVTWGENEGEAALFIDGNPVLRADGETPYSLTWDQLRALPAAERQKAQGKAQRESDLAFKLRSSP